MVPVLGLMPVLLWVGVVCLCFRQLHQTSSLAVGVMEESYRESLECSDEDITDKVGPPPLLDPAGALSFAGTLRARGSGVRSVVPCSAPHPR